MDNRDFKGVWIPREIYLDKSLPWSAKIIFLEIHSFSGGTKECFMSNEYLGEFVGISPTQVSRHISLLKSRGLIELVSFDGVTRVLKSLLKTCVKPQGGIDKNRKGVLIKTATPSKKKPQRGIDKNRKYNNTITNTLNNTNTEFKNDFAFFVDIYYKFYENQFNTKPVFSAVAGKKLKEILKKLEIKNKETATPWSKERGGVLLSHFLKLAYSDKWIKNNFELKNLDSNFNSIVSKTATNGQPIKTPFDGDK